MKVKGSAVRFDKLQPQIVFALVVAESIFEKMFPTQEMVITSVNDGAHMAGSKHYDGAAVDLRIAALNTLAVKQWVEALRAKLGRHFDVVLESDHLHVEYDPKGGV